MASDGAGTGDAAAGKAATYTRKRALEEFALRESDFASAPSKRQRLDESYVHALATQRWESVEAARAAAARIAAERAAKAAERALKEAPCDACGTPGQLKHDGGSGRHVCANCRPCADCGAAVGARACVEVVNKKRHLVCGRCGAKPRYARMWISDAKREYKLTDAELTGVIVFDLPSRYHGVKQQVYRREVAALAASPALAAARASAAATLAAERAAKRAAAAAERAPLEKQRAAVKRRLETLRGMASARGLALERLLDLSNAEAPPPEGHALLPLHAYVHSAVGAARQHSKAAMTAVFDDLVAEASARNARLEALRAQAGALRLELDVAYKEAVSEYDDRFFSSPAGQALLADDALLAYLVRGGAEDELARAVAPAAAAASARLLRVDDLLAAAAALRLEFARSFTDALRGAALQLGSTHQRFVARSSWGLPSVYPYNAVVRATLLDANASLRDLHKIRSLEVCLVSESAVDLVAKPVIEAIYSGVDLGLGGRLPHGWLLSILQKSSTVVRAPWVPLTAGNAAQVCTRAFAAVVGLLMHPRTAPFNALPEPLLLRILNAASTPMLPLPMQPRRQAPLRQAPLRPASRPHRGGGVGARCSHAGCRNTAPTSQPCAFTMCAVCCRRTNPAGGCERHR